MLLHCGKSEVAEANIASGEGAMQALRGSAFGIGTDIGIEIETFLKFNY